MKKNKNLRGLFFVLLLTILVSGCQPTVTTPPIPTVITSTPRASTATPQTAQNPTPVAQPTIMLDHRMLRGINVSVRHPFFESEENMLQLVRDFNLENPWGIHVTAEVSAGYSALADELAAGTVENNIVIGMGSDLLAAQPASQFISLGDNAMDANFGVDGFFDGQSPFYGVKPRFGESIHYTIPLAYNAGILLYNTTWAEELGFTSIPKNREELLEVAQAALDANLNDGNYNNDRTGGLLLSQSPQSALSWYSSYLSDAKDLDIVPQTDPLFLLSSFYFLREIYDASQSWVGVEPQPYRYFSERYAVVAEGTLQDLKHQAAYQESGTYQDNWTTLAYPSDADSGVGHLVLEPLSFAIQHSDSESELAAWIFGAWLMEPVQQARLVEMHGLWPSTGVPNTIAPDYASEHPYWAAALYGNPDHLENNPIIMAVPNTAEWAWKRLVFQDAYQRIYHLDAEYFHSIPEVFNETNRTNEEQQP